MCAHCTTCTPQIYYWNGVPMTPPLWSILGGGALINGDTTSSPYLLEGWINFSAVTLSSHMVYSYGPEKTLISLVDPVSATISIVPELPLQEVGHLMYTAWQWYGCPYGINCLFHIMFYSLYYYYLYYLYIVIVSYLRLYCQFHILFIIKLLFSLKLSLLGTISLFIVLVQSLCWSTNISAKYIMIHLQSFVIIFWFIHWI